VLKGAVARRYAEAVMEIAQQQGTVERWLADVRLIGEAFGNRQLSFVLREPKIPMSRKQLIVRDLLTDKVQHDALNLALVLVQDGLSEAGPRLAQEFERLYDEYRGQAKARVTSALPLDDAERSEIAQALRRVTGKRIILEERVDPSILGGVVARVGDTLIDGSVRRRLALLREQIIKGGGAFGGPSDGRPVPGGGPADGGPAGGPAAGSGGFVLRPAAPPTPEAADGGGTGNGSGPASGGGANGAHNGSADPASFAESAARAPSVAARPTGGPGGRGGQAVRRGKHRGRR
jgi:F-type H+-transporting ATPase subunit delta